MITLVEQIYNNILKDIQIRKTYDEIGYLEDTGRGWAYHNFDHIMNVTNLVENIL